MLTMLNQVLIKNLMEFLILISVLLLAVAILSAHWFLSCSKLHEQNSSISNLPVPPGRMGWPIIGENLAYLLMGRKGTPEKFIQDRMNNYSSQVFKTSLMGESMAVFCGSKGNKFLFSNEFTLVQSWWPHSFERIFDLQSPLKDESKKMKVFLPRFLQPYPLHKYVGVMDLIAKQHLGMDWDDRENVTVMPLVKKYTFFLVCRLFLSIEDTDYITMLNEQFERLSAGLLSLPINLPGTAFCRALKASKFIHKELLATIKQKKIDVEEKRISSTQDLLTEMLYAPDENGVFADEVDIASKFSAVILASYDAPARALTFVVKYLAELPHVYDQVLKEQTGIAKSKGPEELLNWDDIQQMWYSWNVVREVLRFVPPLQGSFREAITDFTYAGFLIPKGWKIYWNSYSTHMSPDYFLDPDNFDPSRFEGNGPTPFTYVPFGGGPRICPGMQYARLEMLVFLHNLVTRFKWEKLIPNEKLRVDPQPRPEYGLPLKLSPHIP